MNLVLMTDKLVACLYFLLFLTNCIPAGLTAALGSESPLRRHILCLVILFKHKGLQKMQIKLAALGLNIGWSPISSSVQLAD